MTRDLSTIVKAYDVRGLVPQELDAEVARALGAAFARFVDAPRIVVARDMRESGVALSAAFAWEERQDGSPQTLQDTADDLMDLMPSAVLGRWRTGGRASASGRGAE